MRTIWCPCHSTRCKCRRNGVVPTCTLAMKICIIRVVLMLALRMVAIIMIRHSNSSSTWIQTAWCYRIMAWAVVAAVGDKDMLHIRTRSVHTITQFRRQQSSHDSTTMLKHRNSSKLNHWSHRIWWTFRNKIHRPIHHSGQCGHRLSSSSFSSFVHWASNHTYCALHWMSHATFVYLLCRLRCCRHKQQFFITIH